MCARHWEFETGAGDVWQTYNIARIARIDMIRPVW
jgi:hypothetical protein